MSENTSPIETQQNKDLPGSPTTIFQHSEEEIREQSKTQALDAYKLSMVVDLGGVLFNIRI